MKAKPTNFFLGSSPQIVFVRKMYELSSYPDIAKKMEIIKYILSNTIDKDEKDLVTVKAVYEFLLSDEFKEVVKIVMSMYQIFSAKGSSIYPNICGMFKSLNSFSSNKNKQLLSIIMPYYKSQFSAININIIEKIKQLTNLCM